MINLYIDEFLILKKTNGKHNQIEQLDTTDIDDNKSLKLNMSCRKIACSMLRCDQAMPP